MQSELLDNCRLLSDIELDWIRVMQQLILGSQLFMHCMTKAPLQESLAAVLDLCQGISKYTEKGLLCGVSQLAWGCQGTCEFITVCFLTSTLTLHRSILRTCAAPSFEQPNLKTRKAVTCDGGPLHLCAGTPHRTHAHTGHKGLTCRTHASFISAAVEPGLSFSLLAASSSCMTTA